MHRSQGGNGSCDAHQLPRIKTLSQRRKFPGLKHERADVILAGALILLEVMQHFKFNETLVSDRGVRFGLILQELGRINA